LATRKKGTIAYRLGSMTEKERRFEVATKSEELDCNVGETFYGEPMQRFKGNGRGNWVSEGLRTQLLERRKAPLQNQKKRGGRPPNFFRRRAEVNGQTGSLKLSPEGN